MFKFYKICYTKIIEKFLKLIVYRDIYILFYFILNN